MAEEKKEKKAFYKSKNMHYLSMLLMLVGFVMIVIGLVTYFTGKWRNDLIPMAGVIIGLIGLWLNKRNMKK